MIMGTWYGPSCSASHAGLEEVVDAHYKAVIVMMRAKWIVSTNVRNIDTMPCQCLPVESATPRRHP